MPDALAPLHPRTSWRYINGFTYLFGVRANASLHESPWVPFESKEALKGHMRQWIKLLSLLKLSFYCFIINNIIIEVH